MFRRFICVLFVMLMATLPMLPASNAQAVTTSMAIHMNSIPKAGVVAGIIHNITITLSQASDDVVLKAFLTSGFATSNSTNNYSWSYSSGTWADDLYDYYIKNDSARFGNEFCFYIALDSKATPGAWTFTTYVDGSEADSAQISVDVPVAGISMSAPTFYFQVFPYGTGFISSWKSDDPANSTSLSTKNIGNVPLTLKITFESMNTFGTSNSFITTNSTGTFLPGEERVHFVDFQAQYWSPRKFTVKGYVNGEPQLLMTPDTVTTIIAAQTTFDVVVTVARPGYDVFQMDGVSVQYKRYYYASYKDTLTMDLYLTGNKSVYVGQSMDNLTFNRFTNQGADTEDDLLLVLSDTEEQQVLVNITCSFAPPWKQPSMLSYAIFDLSLADATDTGTLTSTVVVLSTGEADDDPVLPSPSIVIIAVLAIVFVAIGIFLFKAYRKTEEQRRKELEDRIRKKKEKARKQRRQ